MSAATEIDLDNATGTQYSIEFKRLPGVVYNATRCVIPGSSIGVVNVPTPFKAMPIAGTEISHAAFSMDFIVDENHGNYNEILNWIKGLSFPDTFSQYAELEDSEDGLESDFTVTIYNNQNNPKLRYHFLGGFPVSLGDLVLDSQLPEPSPLQSSASFEYLNFQVEAV